MLDRLVGQYIQVITTQTATEQTRDGAVYTGPWALSGMLVDFDDVMLVLEPDDAPARVVFRAHIIAVDIVDKTPKMPEPVGEIH